MQGKTVGMRTQGARTDKVWWVTGSAGRGTERCDSWSLSPLGYIIPTENCIFAPTVGGLVHWAMYNTQR